ncbi:MAG: hypothetical protein J6N19_09900 [Clostridium sp.]|nr:hypothetical protein [Clostridium sp.]
MIDKSCMNWDGDDGSNKCGVYGHIYGCPVECSEYLGFYPPKKDKEANTMKGKKKILLSDFLQYFGNTDMIQVHIEGDGEWENYIEVAPNSAFLKPVLNWYIVAIGPEESDTQNRSPIIRVSVAPEESS